MVDYANVRYYAHLAKTMYITSYKIYILHSAWVGVLQLETRVPCFME